MLETKDISIVFITYNRADLLKKALENLLPAIKASGLSYEVIVADDCSSSPHSEIINDLKDVLVVRTQKNSGIGANTNNGLKFSTGKMILQVQDDWLFLGSSDDIYSAYKFLLDNPMIGIVQLTSVPCDVGGRQYHWNQKNFIVFRNDRLPWQRACSNRPYSDQPHLKRREFVNEIGPYRENCSMGVCENDYKRRVAQQTKWRVSQITPALHWEHLGEKSSFNTSGPRNKLVRLLIANPLGRYYIEPAIRGILRSIDHFIALLLAK